MTKTLTIQNLIQHFEDRLHQIDRQNLGDVVGKEPQFPQLVIYLGKDAINSHPTVSYSLLQAWPQYQQELKFLGVQLEDGLSYSELASDSDKETKITEAGVQDIASALFGAKMHFRDRSKLLVYYVMDTTSFRSKDDFLAWLPFIRKVKGLLCSDTTDVLDMLIVLLNENLVRQKTAAQIRNCLSSFYNGNDIRNTVNNVLLLSNRRSDNAILEDWEMCYKIISATIALSNNADTHVTSSVFCNSVLTASYAREEKPISQIGQVVVQNLLGELADNIPQTDPKLMEDPSLVERLGMTKNGTFKMLDQYAESSLYALLPTEEQLELFPRRDSYAQTSMGVMSAKNFNEYTMDAWNQYLAGIAASAQEKVAMNSAMRQNWNEEYRGLLVQSFNKEEILYLVDRIADVADIMSKTRLPSQDTKVLDAAKDQLKYMLSNDPQLVEVFVNALRHQGSVALEFTQAWNSLLKSRRRIFDVRDANMVTFYERKVRNFYDRRGTDICTSFAALHNTDELQKFLKSVLEDIIDSDDIFSTAFEEELECRLNEDALPTDTKQYIRKKLTGNEVFTYLQTNFSLGEPVVSAILLKIGTPLYKNLYSNLAPTTYYYNTGNSNAAEALVIYEVSVENLVNGEG